MLLVRHVGVFRAVSRVNGMDSNVMYEGHQLGGLGREGEGWEMMTS